MIPDAILNRFACRASRQPESPSALAANAAASASPNVGVSRAASVVDRRLLGRVQNSIGSSIVKIDRLFGIHLVFSQNRRELWSRFPGTCQGPVTRKRVSRA